MNRPNEQETALRRAISSPAAIGMLKDLMRAFDIDPDLATTAQKEVIAGKLGQVAGESWGWRYVHNVLRGTVEPSRKMIAAILALGAQVDGVPVILSKARPMNLLVLGNVKPGSLVLGDSKPCDNPGCKVNFIPVSNFQTHCCPECTRAHKQWRKQQRKNKKA